MPEHHPEPCAQGVTHIGLYDAATATINTGTGFVEAMFLGNGTNTVTGGSGFINLLELGSARTP